MRIANVDYATLLELVLTKKLLLQYTENEEVYNLFAVEDSVSWEASILKGSNEAEDFDTNYKAVCNKPLAYRSEDGLPKVANSKFADVLSFQVIGLTPLTAPSGATSFIKYAVPFAYTLSGTHMIWDNANFGDYVDFEIGVYFDLENEESFMSFNTFGDGFSVFKEGNLLIDVPTVKTLPSYVNFGYGDMQVFIRTKYVNNGANDAKFVVNLIGWR